MTAAVIDSSATLAWCFEDEGSSEADALLDRISGEGAMVPALWPLELGNVLLQAERRGRISSADIAARLELIATLPIAIDSEGTARALREVLALARAEELTTYDAAYLELAMRRAAPLATKDQALAAAARRLGVEVLPI